MSLQDRPAPVRAMSGQWRLWLIVLAVVLSSACAGRSLRAAAVPQEDIDFAQRYLALFSTRSFPAIEMGMDPSIRDPQIRLKLLQMASVFPREAPSAVRVVLSQYARTADTSASTLSFQYEYPDRWVRADVVVSRTGQAPVIKGLHVQALKEPLERTHRMTLAGKGFAHYAALIASLLVLLFVIYTFVLAVRAPLGAIRWAWAAFILVGVVQFLFNWTTGQLSIVPMGVQLLATGFSRPSPYAPLVISTSIPVGAIVFLIQRRDWLRRPPDDEEYDLEDGGPGPGTRSPRNDGPGSPPQGPRRDLAAAAVLPDPDRDRSQDD